jgi:hypothetical protein
MPVHVVRQNYDVIHALDEADALEGIPALSGKAHLNADGEAYYVLFGSVPTQRPWAVHGPGHMTSEEAAAWVSAEFDSQCDWK